MQLDIRGESSTKTLVNVFFIVRQETVSKVTEFSLASESKSGCFFLRNLCQGLWQRWSSQYHAFNALLL
jgi:hypothetical protein